MPYDEALAEGMRETLVGVEGITERKMFGGLCFMWRGNMLCGIHSKSGMARVGKDNMDAALEIEGTAPLSFTGRPMGGMIDVSDDAWDDPVRRDAILKLCFDFVGSLPPK